MACQIDRPSQEAVTNALRHEIEVDYISMHETLVVAVRAREVVQIELFVREDYSRFYVSSSPRSSVHLHTFPLLLRSAVRARLCWHGHRSDVVIVIVFILLRHSRGTLVYCFQIFLATSCSLSEDSSVLLIFGHGVQFEGRTQG